MNEFIYKKIGSFFLAIMLASMFVGVVSGETCGIKNIQISASKTTGIDEGEQITITVEFDYQRGAMEGTKIDWQVKIWEDDLVGDELMGTRSGSFPDSGPQNEHGTATFTVTPSDYVSIPEGCVIEVYANVQAGWEVGCIHNANSNIIDITVCSACPSCIMYEDFVRDYICSNYPEDACEIYGKSLWYSPNISGITYDSDSRLANKIRISLLWNSPNLKKEINSKVEYQLEQKVEEIECKPVGEFQEVEIFKDNNEIIPSDAFSESTDPELYWIFHAFEVFPYGINHITLTREGGNDYKISGTIKVRVHDKFDFNDFWTGWFGYLCQQAGCVHNFDIDVYGVDFEINDLEVTLDSSKMHCEGDPDEIKCCLDGCCSGECCSEGTPNAGICYDSSNPEDGCCQYKVNDEEKCYEGNHPPDKCTTCYGGSWHSGWWCEEGECVPEASTLVLFATGLLCMAGYLGLRRKEK